MEESKDYKKLDELFEKARSSKPVMDANEIRNLISTAPFASLDNTYGQKSNKNLYLLLIGVALVASIGCIWYMLSDSPSSVQNSTVVSTDVLSSQNSQGTDFNSDKEENKIDSSVSENLANNDESSNAVNENSSVITNVTKPLTTPVKEVAEPTIVKEKSTPEPVATASSNKTSIVRGSDMEVKMSDAGKDITMKVKQDYSVADLTINGKEIAEADYKKYKNYIDQGVQIAKSDRSDSPDANTLSTKSAEEQKRDDINTKLFNVFSDQLKKDKLINADKFSFRLTSTEMQIDGKTLPATVQKKYLELFSTTAGRELGGTTFKFEHGLK